MCSYKFITGLAAGLVVGAAVGMTVMTKKHFMGKSPAEKALHEIGQVLSQMKETMGM